MPDASHPHESAAPHSVPEVVPDQVIDSVVDHMAESAASLSESIGAEPPADSADQLLAPAVVTETAENLDQQLSQAQELLDAAQHELGSVGDSAAEPALDAGARDTASASAPADSAAEASISDEEVRKLVATELVARASARAKSAAFTLRLAGAAVRLLEIIDRPFKSLSMPMRRIIGWSAIGTLTVAMGTIVMSYF